MLRRYLLFRHYVLVAVTMSSNNDDIRRGCLRRYAPPRQRAKRRYADAGGAHARICARDTATLLLPLHAIAVYAVPWYEAMPRADALRCYSALFSLILLII